MASEPSVDTSPAVLPAAGETTPGATRVKALAPRASIDPVAHARAGTLMAGQTAGSQGPVRVWAPERRLLQNGLISLTVFSLLFLGLSIWIHALILNPSSWLLIMTWTGLLRAWKRPCYVSTDDAGIAVVTRTGTRSVRWDEITQAERRVQPEGLILKASGPDIEILTTGYPSGAQQELLDTICSRSRLRKHPALPVYMSARALEEAHVGRPPVGVLFGSDERGFIIVAAIRPQSEASHANLRAGDRLITLEGVPALELGLEECNRRIEAAGSRLDGLKLLREYLPRELWVTVPVMDEMRLGAALDRNNEGDLEVKSLASGGPLFAAGLRAGDVALSVNGIPTDAMDDSGIAAELAGPAGTMIEMRVRRLEEPIIITLEARPTLANKLEDRIAGRYAERTGASPDQTDRVK